MTGAHRIAVIPGDGIGAEVVPEGLGAIEDVLSAGPDGAPLTPDLHGRGTAAELGATIADRVRERVRDAAPRPATGVADDGARRA